MDQNLYQGIVGAEFVVINRNFSQLNDSLLRIQNQILAQKLEAAHIQTIKDVVFRAKTFLEGLLPHVASASVIVYLHAYQTRCMFRSYGITDATFTEFGDKEYFTNIVRLLDRIAFESASQLTNTEREDLEHYAWAKPLIPDLAELCALNEARRIIDSHPMAFSTFLKGFNDGKRKRLVQDEVGACFNRFGASRTKLDICHDKEAVVGRLYELMEVLLKKGVNPKWLNSPAETEQAFESSYKMVKRVERRYSGVREMVC